MVVHAFPAAKLAVLLAKQISKPIAEVIKSRAKGHPLFRRYICIPPAQFYNWCEIKTKLWLLNVKNENISSFGQKGKTKMHVPPLSEAVAIELGANILGEVVIFLIGAGLLMLEYQRQVRKEERKESTRKDELNRLDTRLYELKTQMSEQEEQIEELYSTIQQLGQKVLKVPWKPHHKPKSKHQLDDKATTTGESPAYLSALQTHSDKNAPTQGSTSTDLKTQGKIMVVKSDRDGNQLANKGMSDNENIAFNNIDASHNENTISSLLFYVLNDVFYLNKIFFSGTQQEQSNYNKTNDEENDVFKK